MRSRNRRRPAHVHFGAKEKRELVADGSHIGHCCELARKAEAAKIEAVFLAVGVRSCHPAKTASRLRDCLLGPPY
jgi:hypothetical protein